MLMIIWPRFSRPFLFWIAFFLLALTAWIHTTFGQINLQQFQYHLEEGFEGLRDADPNLILSFLLVCVAVPSLSLVLAKFISRRVFNILQIKYSNLNNHRLYYVIRNIHHSHLTAVMAALCSAGFFLDSLLFFNHLKLWQHENFIDQHYVAPTPSTIHAPTVKRNLVLLYVESLETSYRDSNVFSRNLLSALDKATEDWVSFDYKPTGAEGWTIGALVATQCGVPLRPRSWSDKREFKEYVDGNTLGEKAPTFMPGIDCLGDILASNGYRNVFLGGADLDFAGKRKFLTQHGYQDVWGRDEWEKLNLSIMSPWGLYDDLLLQHALRKLEELHSENQPFNLTVLTLDTHHPDGFISPTCKNRGVDNYTGIVECTSELVAEFIHEFTQRGYSQTTDFVILGDHLAMRNAVSNQLSKVGERRIFIKFLTSDSTISNRNTIYPYSVLPSILTSLGFSIVDGRLGLGISAFGNIDAAKMKLFNETNLDLKLSSPAPIYSKFWWR